ncbi:MAG TPA: hypothetical protein VKY85_15590 [Candidatus Angelobacter sp.]|nr:hypothetical protein [Candidatus Angelobacter sp.]
MRSVTPLLLGLLLFSGYGFAEKPKNSDAATITFDIRIGQNDKGTEEYKIVHSKGGYLLTSTVHLRKYGETVSSEQQQRLAADWSPLGYSLKTTMTREQRTTEASIANGKVKMHSESGADVKDKTIDVQSPTLVFDNIVPSQFQVLVKQYNALHSQHAVQFQLLVPQILGQFSGTFQAAGSGSGTLGDHKVVLEKYILETRGLSLEIWADGQGQLMRVYLPARDTEFVRTDFRMNPGPVSATVGPVISQRP